jgi:hypothetical protein
MANGCGPEWLNRFKVTDKLRGWMFDWFHEASCDKHDEGYLKGGDETRRMYCDWRFLVAMLHDAKRIGGFRGWLAKRQAGMYYRLVRLFGRKYFNFKDES